MKHFIGCLILVGVVFLLIVQPLGSPTIRHISQSNSEMIVSFTPHAPIVITSDVDFISQAWPGFGNSTNPFIIENLNITSDDDCIDISGTTAYFVIRNCWISSETGIDGYGVHLDSLSNGVVVNCTITKKAMAFYIGDCSDSYVTQNNVSQTSYIGISVGYSTNFTVSRNRIGYCGDAGIALHRSDDSRISNNSVSYCEYAGIYLYQTHHSNVTTNSVSSSNPSGIYLDDSDYCNVIGNTLYNNSIFGLDLTYSGSCLIANNTLLKDGLTLYGTEYFWSHEISGNSVNGKELGYFDSRSHEFIDASEFGQIILVKCQNVTLENATIFDTNTGLTIAYSSNCTARNFSIMDCSYYGVNFEEGEDNQIQESEITGCARAGVRAWRHPKSTTILECEINRNPRDGVSIVSNNQVKVEDCSIFENGGNGIYVEGRLNSTNNHIFNNIENGIYLPYGDWSFIINNSILENHEYGVRMGSISSTYIYDNMIGYNLGENAWEDNSGATWSINEIGNYWSDFDGEGTYEIPGPGDGIDSYPKTLPYVNDIPSVEIMASTLGNYLQWNPISPRPSNYIILLDGVMQISDEWDGSSITFYIDNLSPGNHIAAIIVRDLYGATAEDIVDVSVFDDIPPEIIGPNDITMYFGESPSEILWVCFDHNPESQRLLVNDAQIRNSPWSGENISIDLTTLAVGSYNYTLCLYDTNGITNIDTVMVEVLSIEPSDTSATESTETGNGALIQMEPLILILGIFALIGIIVVLTVVSKRRN